MYCWHGRNQQYPTQAPSSKYAFFGAASQENHFLQHFALPSTLTPQSSAHLLTIVSVKIDAGIASTIVIDGKVHQRS